MVCYLSNRSRAQTPSAIQSPVQRKKNTVLNKALMAPVRHLWPLLPVLNSHKLLVISGFIQWAHGE